MALVLLAMHEAWMDRVVRGFIFQWVDEVGIKTTTKRAIEVASSRHSKEHLSGFRRRGSASSDSALGRTAGECTMHAGHEGDGLGVTYAGHYRESVVLVVCRP